MGTSESADRVNTRWTAWLRVAGPLLALVLCGLALYALHRQLASYHLHDIRRALASIPAAGLWFASLLTVLGYAAMTGYDALALRYIGQPLAYRKTALASFMSYAFSNNMGFGMLAGGSVRYRLYGGWGLSALDITRVILFCSFTFLMGLFVFGGVVFLLFPLPIPLDLLALPCTTTRPLGVLFLALVAMYAGLRLFRHGPLRVWALEFPVPPWPVLGTQVLIASVDWALAGSTLYVLLPHHPAQGLPSFFAIFILAQVAGIVSQVPGGIGIFETVVVLLLSSSMPAPDVVAALLAFRALYYLVPFGIATALLGGFEVGLKRQTLALAARTVGRWAFGAVPSVMAALTFLAGTTLLFSGATPDLVWHVRHVVFPLPLPLVEVSHFAGSVVGVWLLMLALGIQRRLDAAYVLTVVLLAFGACFSMLKGFDYHESLMLLAVMATLMACRGDFTRRASLFSGEVSPGWVVSVGAVLLATVGLTLFAYKHVEYSSDLWWRFALDEQAPRSLRALVGAACALLAFALGRLLRPARPRFGPADPEMAEKVAAIVSQSSDTSSNLALLGDKSFLFSESGKAFIMFGAQHRCWIAMGDPVGPVDEWQELLWRFREECHEHALRPVFYEVGSDHLSLYLDLGLNLLKLGEDARVALPAFSMEGSGRSSLRSALRRLEREGCAFDLVPQAQTEALLPELRRISDAWLEDKHTREKHFSLGRFDEAYVKRFPVAVVRRQGRIEAFATVWQSAGLEELSVDLMRHLPDAPGGLMDFLFVHLMSHGREAGYRWFNLGMAPLSGLPQHELAPLWNRVGGFLFQHGEHFYNFQGLRQYKEKFDPEWRPRYLASPGGLALPQVLGDLSSLISGGIGGVVGK